VRKGTAGKEVRLTLMAADEAQMDVRYGTGDDGSTWLLEGKRVRKHHPRVVACGEVDELNSVLGVCRSLLRDRHPDLDAELRKVQEALFRIGAELASEVPENLGIKQIGKRGRLVARGCAGKGRFGAGRVAALRLPFRAPFPERCSTSRGPWRGGPRGPWSSSQIERR